MHIRKLNRLRFWLGLLASLILLLNVNLSEPQLQDSDFRVWAENSMVRVFPETPPTSKNSIEIAAARNEFEPFQVIISARTRKLEDITATVSDLEDGSGNRIDRSLITLYREQYVYIRNPSPFSPDQPGIWPDALVPFVNPVDGKPVPGMQLVREEAKGRSVPTLIGARFVGIPFDVWPGNNQPLWADVFIPPNTAPGNYTGKFTVAIPHFGEFHLPIKLTVWNFTLPDGPPLATRFGGLSLIAQKHQLVPGSPDYTGLYQRYAAAMAEHRLDPPVPDYLQPPLKLDGTIDWKKTHEELKRYITTYHIGSIQIPNYPFADPLGSNRKYVVRYLQSYYEYLKTQGWEKGAYYFPVDEPNSKEAYDQVRAYAQLAHEANPGIRLLCTEQPYPQDNTWGDLRNSVDIWCPLFSFFDEESAQAAQQRGNEIWTYTALCQKSPPYHPQYERVASPSTLFWQIDFPILHYRLPLWVCWRYNINGLLYWSTVHWDSPERDVWTDPGFRNRYNGEGFLFYPGTEAGIAGPVASLRLKALREGMEDFAYFVLLAKLGDRTYLDQAVSKIGTSWWKWDDDPEHLFETRAEIAKRIGEKLGSISQKQ